MLRNYLIVALRSLLRRRVTTAINIGGLAVGLAACALILLYVHDELRHDRFHQNGDRTFRVLRGGSARTSYPLGEVVQSGVPQVEEMTRLSCKWERLVAHGDRGFWEADLLYADPSFFEVFSFPLLRGDPRTALSAPFTMVISETAAQRYFGDENPLGKTLTVDDEREYTVTGVAADVPPQSHFHFDCLATFAGSDPVFYEGMLEHWGVSNFYTYVRLRGDGDRSALEAAMTELIAPVIGAKHPELTPSRLILQPLSHIRLHSAHLWGDIEPQGEIAVVYALSAIAVLILVIACINFTNLATVRSVERMREVGLRKVVGALRRQLAMQFLGESIVQAILALILAAGLVEAALPAFGALVGKEGLLLHVDGWTAVGIVLGAALVVGSAAGLYPALCLSSFLPVSALKGRVSGARGGAAFRRGLVVAQFAITIGLMAATGVLYRQVEYMRAKDLGFASEHVVVLQVPDGSTPQLIARLTQNPAVVSAGAASDLPPDRFFRSAPVAALDGAQLEQWMRIVVVDYDLMQTLRLRLLAGREFSAQLGRDPTEALILSEAGARALGWDSPQDAVGKRCRIDGERTVVGVVGDLHYEPLQAAIEPVAFEPRPEWTHLVAARLRAGQIPQALSAIEATWAELYPAWPFRYHFVDQSFDQAYRAEERTQKIIGSGALLAVLVACLGLYGLSSLVAEQRTREIGVRKVLGASVPNVVGLLAREMCWLVLAANLIAWPAATWTTNHWLERFAYRIDPEPQVLAISGLLALGLALAAVSYHVIRAALSDPVQALRCE